MRTRLMILLLILGALIGIIAVNTNASVTVPEKLVAAAGTSGEVYVVGKTLRSIQNQPFRFGQLVITFNLEYVYPDSDGTAPKSHKVVQTIKLAFLSDCLSELPNHTILISGKTSMFDAEKNAHGQDLWLVMVTQRVTQLVCNQKYDSVKSIPTKEAQELITQYSSATND